MLVEIVCTVSLCRNVYLLIFIVFWFRCLPITAYYNGVLIMNHELYHCRQQTYCTGRPEMFYFVYFFFLSHVCKVKKIGSALYLLFL